MLLSLYSSSRSALVISLPLSGLVKPQKGERLAQGAYDPLASLTEFDSRLGFGRVVTGAGLLMMIGV